MDDDEREFDAQWFYNLVYGDEPIKPKPPSKTMPPLLRAARALNTGPSYPWQSDNSLFLKQAKLLEHYEDDYRFRKKVVRYYPTYQSLSDSELRGYFSWRTKYRRGQVEDTSASFVYLYIYELLNQVGVTDPLDGFRKLEQVWKDYELCTESLSYHMPQWLRDYAVYYDLDPSLLSDDPEVLQDKSIAVLDEIDSQPEEAVMAAVHQLAPSWLSRSKCYKQNQADYDTVILRVLRRVSDHYASCTQRTMVEQYLGYVEEGPVTMFRAAVFCDIKKVRTIKYAVDPIQVYRCIEGMWLRTYFVPFFSNNSRFEGLTKAIDGVLREEWDLGHPIRYEIKTKWMEKIIREEAQTLLAEKKEAESRKITIDYTQLAKIRQEAALTQDKLTVEDEIEEELPPVEEVPAAPEPAADSPLSPLEYRLLHCLLYGGDFSWVQKEGYILSVLLDSINDKLYDSFQDSVVDDTPAVIEDYVEDLKEMVAL